MRWMTQVDIDISRIFCLCVTTRRLYRRYFISPLKVCSGTQENTTKCSLLHVVGNLKIFIIFNIGPESELAVLVITIWTIIIFCGEYTSDTSFSERIFIEPEHHKPYQYNNDLEWDILEWESYDQCSCEILDYIVLT